MATSQITESPIGLLVESDSSIGTKRWPVPFGIQDTAKSFENARLDIWPASRRARERVGPAFAKATAGPP